MDKFLSKYKLYNFLYIIHRWEDVELEYPLPKELRVSKLQSYLIRLLVSLLLLSTILLLFILPSHVRKYKAKATHNKWR